MPRDDVQILIGAENRASTKLRQVSNDVNRLQTSARSLRASRTLFDAAGLGQVSSLLGTMEQSMSDTADQAGRFNAAAIATKGAMVGVVAVVGFQLGQAIIGATQRWEEFNDAIKETDRLEKQRQSQQQARIAFEEQRNALLFEGEELAKRQQALLDQQETKLKTAQGQVRLIREEIARLNAGRLDILGDFDPRNLALVQQAEADLKRQQELVESLSADVQSRRNQLQLAAISQAQKEADIRASQLETESKLIQNLEVQLVKLRDGAEAASRLKLQFDGISQPSQDKILELEKAIDLAEQQAKLEAARVADQKTLEQLKQAERDRRRSALQQEVQALQATESRTLSRGPAQENPIVRQNEQIIALQQEIARKSSELSQLKKLDKLDEIVNTLRAPSDGGSV